MGIAGKSMSLVTKVGVLLGAVALQEFARPKFKDYFDPSTKGTAAIVPPKKGTAGLGDDIFGDGSDDTDLTTSLPSDVDPGGYVDPSSYYGGYSQGYYPQQSYYPQQTYYPQQGYYPQAQTPYYPQTPAANYTYAGQGYYPNQGGSYYPQYNYNPASYPAGTYPGSTYPGVYNPATSYNPYATTAYNPYGTTPYNPYGTTAMKPAEATADALIQYGLGAGILQTSCVGGIAVAGLSQYHNCMFTAQTARGPKTLNFRAAALAVKRYQKTGKI